MLRVLAVSCVELKGTAMTTFIHKTKICCNSKHCTFIQLTDGNFIRVVNVTTEYSLLFTQPSNIVTEWIWDKDNTKLDDYSVLVPVTMETTFSTPGSLYMYAITGNVINRVKTESIYSEVQYPVNGFNATITSIGPLKTSDTVTFTISRSVNALIPMGNLYMDIHYSDDETSDFVNITTSVLAVLTGSGYTSSHTAVSGSLNISIDINSESHTQYVVIHQQIVEDITDLTLAFENLGEVVSFSFSNTPSDGFNYIITFDDGTDILNDPLSTLNPYIDPKISHTYNTSATYSVKMLAWNSFYVSVCSYDILVSISQSVPIRDIVLTPSLSDPPIVLPVYDGTMEFSYEMIVSHPDPTNVTCMHMFGDTMDIYIVKTNITFGTPVVKVHTFLNTGNFTVNFTCYNEVSSVMLITKVSIIDVFPDDYIISYPLKIGMNTTKIPPGDDFSDPVFLDEQQNVRFHVELKGQFTKLPPGADIEFDFGDMTNTEELQDVEYGDTISHIYTDRGIYTVTMTITAENGETASKTFNIQIGLTDLVISSYTGLVAQTEFTFQVSGLGAGATYELTIGNSLTFTLNQEPSIKTHTYTNYEKYYPHVISRNSDIYEEMYSRIPISAENAIPALDFNFPNTVNLPPGDIIINISLSGGGPQVPFVTCTFLTSYKYAHLTTSNPITLSARYNTEGSHTSLANCSNSVSHVSYTIIVNVVMKGCFDDTGIFDSNYSNYTNPLILFAAQDTYLESIMSVYCTNQTFLYKWEMFTRDGIGLFTIRYDYQPAIIPDSRIIFGERTIDANLYKITLNITIDNQWEYEATFVKFESPPPYATIIGGDIKSIKLNELTVDFDALTQSYDVLYGTGSNGNLIFTWTCFE